MSDANTNYGGAGNDTLLMDFNIFNQRRTSMLSAVDRLVFDTRPSQMEGKVCGTETIMELMSQWDKVTKTSMNFREFYMGCVDKSLVETADSIYATNDQVANALNIFGDSTNVFGSVQGDDTLVEMLANHDPGLIDAINGLENAGDQDPGYLAALRAAMLQSGYNLNKVGDREEFMKKYNVDEATMERVEAMAKECENGDTSCLDNYNQFQNLSKEEWGNLTDEQYQEFSDLAILNAYAGYMVEHGKDNLSASELETYTTISEKSLSKMYAVDKNGRAKLDLSIVNAMMTTYDCLGAKDTLAYNILMKVQKDKTLYYTFDASWQSAPKDVTVNIYYDESGLSVVQIQDSCITDNIQEMRFLAAGKDQATKYFEKARSTVKNYDNHGMTNDELIGMIQVAENPNDLQIAENIAKSDHEFKINGKNAFDIYYWEDGQLKDQNYSGGISNNFSITLGQMGANMIEKGDFENYKEFLKAAMSESAKENGHGHDIVLDIASGAGIYADTCGQMVIDDEIGGDNDKELKKRLNAAADNFGVFSDMHREFKTGMFSEYKITDISDVGYDKGNLVLNFTADKKTLFFTDKGENIAIETKIVTGKKAFGEKFEIMQEDLRNELVRKRQELLISTAIDVVGIVSPMAKNVLTVANDIASAENATTDTVDMIKDGMKLSEGRENAVTFGNTILGSVFKYNELMEKYKEDSEEITDLKSMLTYYAYSTGADSIGLYDYDNIRKAQQWGENGISQITTDCDLSNEEIYDKIYGHDSKDQYNRDIVRTIANNLCKNDENKSTINLLGPKANNPQESDYNAVYELIKKEAGYTKEEIDNAMQVAIYGHSDNADAEYQTVTDVPQDLMYACLDALEDNYNIDAFTYWG